MRNLLDNQEFSDIVFIFPEEDKQIHAHKGILDARCDGFHALLRYVIECDLFYRSAYDCRTDLA